MTLPERKTIIESAIRAVEGILKLDILPAHKRKLIDRMIWVITEIDGKFKTRFRSKAALNCGNGVKLQHEHVIPRGWLTKTILARPSKARRLMRSAVACVVTVDEHRRLSAVSRQHPRFTGWERYRKAGIIVHDTTAGKVFRFPQRG